MKKYVLILSLSPLLMYSQVGINTKTPQKMLHVNGSLQVTGEINVGGNATTQGSAGTAGQVLVSNGANQAPSWQTIVIPTLPTLATGTVISVNGQLMIAQEIIALMTQDVTLAGQTATATPHVIPYLTNEIIDNENTFSGSSSSNSFTVSATGIYQIIINVQLDDTARSSSPSIGVWNNTNSNWIARINDMYSPYTASGVGRQTYTLITSASLESGKTYSFRATNTSAFIIRAFSGGSSGAGPVTYVSVKRLN